MRSQENNVNEKQNWIEKKRNERKQLPAFVATNQRKWALGDLVGEKTAMTADQEMMIVAHFEMTTAALLEMMTAARLEMKIAAHFAMMIVALLEMKIAAHFEMMIAGPSEMTTVDRPGKIVRFEMTTVARFAMMTVALGRIVVLLLEMKIVVLEMTASEGRKAHFAVGMSAKRIEVSPFAVAKIVNHEEMMRLAERKKHQALQRNPKMMEMMMVSQRFVERTVNSC